MGILTLLPDPVVCIDGSQAVLFANTAFCEIYGGSPSSWLGQTLSVLPSSDNLAPTKDAKLETQAGEGRWIEWRSAQVSGDGRSRDDETAVLWLGRDVTDRRKSEKALEDLHDSAAQESEAKGAFLATMSHEIRTPLNGVLGMSQLLMSTDLSAQQQNYLKTINESGELLLSIVNDILDYSKLESGKIELEDVDFDLAEALQHVVELLAPKAFDKGVEVASMISPGSVQFLRGDVGRIRQVLLNLVGNAIKFTGEGGVLVRARSWRTDSDPEKVSLRIEVQDTGIGMSEAVQSKIFEEFAQADVSHTRIFGGTGLGLAICRKLVECMGGEIGVESSENEGSTFWFTLPLIEADEGATFAQQVPKLYGLKTMIVTDSQIVAEAVRAKLLGANSDTVAVSSPTEALSLLSGTNHTSITTLIFDAGFGSTETETFITQLTRESPDEGPKTLVLSEPGQKEQVDKFVGLGFDGYLTKPLRQATIIRRIQYVHGLVENEDEVVSLKTEMLKEHGHMDLADGEKYRILLAEDNQINQMLVVSFLRKHGHTVDTASNGEEVLIALDRSSYDIILMDMRMPLMDGLEATREIRKGSGQTKDIPIVALTANAAKEDRDACLAAGMHDFLTKPIEPDALYEVIERWTKIGPKARVS